jgi:hypothetical protein
MMQNGGNYAKFKLVPPQPSTLWGENVGKIGTVQKSLQRGRNIFTN